MSHQIVKIYVPTCPVFTGSVTYTGIYMHIEDVYCNSVNESIQLHHMIVFITCIIT